MEAEFLHIEKDLAMEAWILYAFKIYDTYLQEDLDLYRLMTTDFNFFNWN